MSTKLLYPGIVKYSNIVTIVGTNSYGIFTGIFTDWHLHRQAFSTTGTYSGSNFNFDGTFAGTTFDGTFYGFWIRILGLIHRFSADFRDACTFMIIHYCTLLPGLSRLQVLRVNI